MTGGPDRGDHQLVAGSVKICGIREPHHARAVVEAGADLVGFIFAPARRRVTAETARRCIAEVRAVAGGGRVRAVGVFVDAAADEINGTVETAGLDLVQLHGSEPPALLAELTRPVVKVVRPAAGTPVAAVSRLIESYRRVPNAPIAFLVDGYADWVAGGEGIRTDWGVASALARHYPVFLAGGLAAQNVGEAIGEVRPLGVDVSSGVERAGIKDGGAIFAFVTAAKEAFGEGLPQGIGWSVIKTCGDR